MRAVPIPAGEIEQAPLSEKKDQPRKIGTGLFYFR